METNTVRTLDEDTLITCINTLRDVLNEMCSTIDGFEPSTEKLIVSQLLDQLIVEYMNLKKMYK